MKANKHGQRSLLDEIRKCNDFKDLGENELKEIAESLTSFSLILYTLYHHSNSAKNEQRKPNQKFAEG